MYMAYFFLRLIVLALTLLAHPTSAQPAVAPTAQRLASDVWWLPGGLLPHRQPDGNSVVLQGPEGLVVFDTGRHPWHSQAILDFAHEQGLPIVSVVNSHWHLDHVSGNPALKAAFPKAKVYASDAIDNALRGFLKDSIAGAADYLKTAGLPPETAEDIRLDIATIANGAALRPDTVVRESGERVLAGRRLQMHLVVNGPTAADVWLYDPKTRIAAVADLVTLPAPFLDTACVSGWLAALDDLAALPFATLVPGHGTPMDRGGFDIYHAAFKSFVACALSDKEARACALQWSQDVNSLIAAGGFDPRQGQGMAAYYVADVLRPNGGNSKSCAAPHSPAN
jgi:glyoxylase-like metal-dependent hydrolase (beta-lactamase superfamily II)